MSDLTNKIKEFVQEEGIDVVGIGKIDRKGFTRCIVLGKLLPVGLRPAKSFVGVVPEYLSLFAQLNIVLNKLEEILLAGEFRVDFQNAFSFTGDIRIFAERAGVGSKGANELILNPTYGANVMYAVLYTDCNILKPDQPIDKVCIRCHRCWDACPADALGPEGLNVARCLPYSLRACQNCVDACPIGEFGLKSPLLELDYLN